MKHSRGFTLIETVISLGIFVMLSLVIYQSISSVFRIAGTNRESTSLSALADQYLEIARNLPYAQVGTTNGNPHGNLPDLPNAVTTTFNGGTYKIYYDVAYIDDPADGKITLGTDSAANDYKQIKLYIQNTKTAVTASFLTTVVPKGLESLSSGGAIAIQVIDATGDPVPDAVITITNTALASPLNLSRLSDASGNWIEVGLPTSSNSYHIVVTKNGYSTDQTYPSTGGNPNPTKPDATVANGQVTNISFAIDLPSTLTFSTVNQSCAPVSSVGLAVRGSKLIGTPSVYKFNNTYTSNSSGLVSLSNIEWDNYVPALTGTTYMIYGSSPIQQINLLPNTNQTFNLVLGPTSTNSVLVIVKDAGTGDPLEGATVNLQKVSPVTDNIKYTGGSLWSQQSWSGGSGQAAWSNTTKYFSDDGNISTSGTPTGLRLLNSGGKAIVTSGSLISSTFDTGTTATSYTTLNYQPTSQSGGASVKFQIASNNDNATWNFTGPDGTASTYYTTSGSTISTTNNGNRYVRYKVFLATTNVNNIPVLTSISLNYVSGCFTPGQVIFTGLTAGTGVYKLIVSMPGYQTRTLTGINSSGYQTPQVDMSH